MARLKRSSSALEQATRRLAGTRSINETLDFGDGLSLREYDTRIEGLQTYLSNYNTMLSTLDEMAGQITLMEKELRSYSEKMLMGVATRYGKDSLQYMQAGGKQRKSSKRTAPNTITTMTAPTTTVEAVMALPVEKAKTNGNGAKATAE